MKFNTKLLHGKAGRNTPDGATLPGISQVSAFSYDSAEHLEKVFGNKSPGFAYTRIGNPTVAAFEQRINEVEGGTGAVACASGMAAITVALLNVLSAGDEIIEEADYSENHRLIQGFRSVWYYDTFHSTYYRGRHQTGFKSKHQSSFWRDYR